MRVTILLLALVSAIALAATNTAVAPRPVASQEPQTTSHKPQATGLGTESITIPQMLSYQGKLTDTLGQSVPNGNYQLTFKLYKGASGGSAIWTEAQTVLVSGGLFSALLGSVVPITSLPDSGALYLGLQIATAPELSPRLRIASAAYAYKADTANYALAAGGGSGGTVTSVSQATGVVCSPNPITTTGTVRLDTTYSDGRYIKNQSGVYQTANWQIAGQGRDSLATASSGLIALYGVTSGNNWGVWGASTTFPGVEAQSHSTSYGALEAVNSASSASGACSGVAGYASAGYGVYGSSSGNHGVYGSSSANGKAGVYGTSTAGSSGYGVYGANTTGDGVYGTDSVTASSFHFPVYARNLHASGVGILGTQGGATLILPSNGCGVAGDGTKFGVWGNASDTASGTCGGWFNNGKGDYAYVAYYSGGTHYKINGSGSVSTIMATREGKKNLFAPEMPEAYFEDCGEGQLANGHCRVNLEKLFSDCVTVNAEHPLKVFVQVEDDCKGVYVNKDATGFDVHELQGGTGNAHFSWRVLGKWKGNENVRLPEAPGPQPTVTAERQVPVEGKTTTATPPKPVEVKSATSTQSRPVPGLK